MRKGYTEIGTVELNNQIGEPGLGPDKIVEHHKLALVSSSKVELSLARFGAQSGSLYTS
jgi:hypothetical protein